MFFFLFFMRGQSLSLDEATCCNQNDWRLEKGFLFLVWLKSAFQNNLCGGGLFWSLCFIAPVKWKCLFLVFGVIIGVYLKIRVTTVVSHAVWRSGWGGGVNVSHWSITPPGVTNQVCMFWVPVRWCLRRLFLLRAEMDELYSPGSLPLWLHMKAGWFP